MNKEILDSAMNAFAIESESLLKTAEVLDREEFARAVEVLSKAERIGASGCGHTGIACQHFAHLMCCIERPARFISPAEAVHGGLGFLQKGDVILLASRGGKTDELMQIADVCRQKGVTIIGVTENTSSLLAEKSDIVLAMAVTRECDKYNCQGTTSFAVTSAIFDALQTALVEVTGFQNESFAVIHPGGAVGKRLNKK
ncbi:MAG: SIS domain-containing protein [Ruminococcaceae bacterium]|nr:SIS domain-containing protein [Oscillospiraceae bacterium]